MKSNVKSNKLFDQINKLNFFNKINVLYVVLFLAIALIFPFGVLNQIGSGDIKIYIRIFDIDFRKTDLMIILLLIVELLLSINYKFKRFYLNFTGMSSDIYARFILKLFMFGLLIVIGDFIIYFKINMSQSIGFGVGYYLLGVVVVVGLVLDYLFLQRKYKLDKKNKTMQVGIDHNSKDNTSEIGDNFSGLFDQEG